MAGTVDHQDTRQGGLLDEVESKRLLAEAGIPTSGATAASTPEEAVRAADAAGYPVVLKILSPDIVHKSDVGGVVLNLDSPEAVRRAFESITAAARAAAPLARIDGVSVQRQAPPGIEVIVGMTRDPQFGPVIMFGLGGIFVEVLRDVAFRVVPLTPRDAREIVREIRGFPVLQGVRGGPPADLAALESLILSVSRFVEAHPEIEELDLNPVFAYPDGALAVDARIVTATAPRAAAPPASAATPTSIAARLERALNPRTVAVVGDKRASGYTWLRNLKPFTGKTYSVQIDPNDIPGIEEMGIPNFASLLDIPDEIDYVICAVPRQVAPRVVADAAKKGVGGVGMFTSGFAETGEELGITLQNEIQRIARENDLLVIGPNCMGLYNPRLGVRFSADQPAGEGGSVGLISQSGTHGINISLVAAANGIRLSKAVSIGNAIILDVPDYLEYFAQDDETKAIAVYVEGVKDGERFARVLREAAARKPVLIWKGGQTADGARATQSHTASLSSQIGIWDALIRQAGAIRVDTLEEMLDTLKLLLLARPPRGNRLALMAMTGGPSVVITDAFSKAGFSVPELTPASYEELATFFNVIGGSYRNPFDMGGTIGGPQGANLDRLFDIIERDENIDAVVMDIAALFMARQFIQHPERLDEFIGRLSRHRDRSAKPFITIMNPAHMEAEVIPVRERLQQAGFPVLPSFERAAAALARVAAHARRGDGL